jgi:hypothetical protein
LEFNRTRAWGERSGGFILGLILTGALVILVAGVFVTQERQLMAQFATAASSPPANTSSFAQLLGMAGVNSPITGQQLGGNAAASLNGASAVETMLSMLITLCAGVIALGLTSVLALLVLASQGMSAGSIIGAAAGGSAMAARAATRAAQQGGASGPRGLSATGTPVRAGAWWP